jgi:hypothetical protein
VIAAATHVQQAESYARWGKTRQALTLWREVFGGAFPTED